MAAIELLVGVTFGTADLVDFEPKLMGNELFWIGPNADGMPPSWQDPRFLYCRRVGAVPIIGMRLDGDSGRYQQVIDHLSNLPNWFPLVYVTEHAEPEADYRGNNTAFVQNYRDWYLKVIQQLPPTVRASIKAGPVLTQSWTEDPALGGGNWSRFDPGLAYSDFFGANMLVDPGVQPNVNVAPNPSLEVDASGYAVLTAGNSNLTRVSGGAYDGTWFGRVTWSSAQVGDPDGGVLLPQFDLPYVGADLTLECVVRSSREQTVRLQVWCYDGDGVFIGDASGPLVTTAGAGSWTLLSRTFSFPEGTSSVRPSVRADQDLGELWQTGDTLDVDALSARVYAANPTVASSYPAPADLLAGFRDYRLDVSDDRPRLIPLLGAIGLPYDVTGVDRGDWLVDVTDEMDAWSLADQGWSLIGFTWLHGEWKSGKHLVGLGSARYYQLTLRQSGLNTLDDYAGDPLPHPLYQMNEMIIWYSADPSAEQPSTPATPPNPAVPPTTIELPPGGVPISGPAAARLLAADYTVLVTDANLNVLGDPIYEWDTLQCAIRWKEPGSGSITVPAHQYIRAQVVPGSRIVVIRRVLGTYHILLAGPMEKVQRERSDDGENGGVGKLTISFVEDLAWLAARLAFPNPALPIDQQISDYWNYSGDPEAAMLQLVDTQAGPGALPQRRVPGLVVAPYSGVAGTGTVALGDTSDVAPRERLEKLTDVLRKISTLGANPVGSRPYHPDSLGFRTRQTQVGGQNVILFEPIRSRDLSGEVHFSFGRGNLEYYSFELEAPSLTHAMVGGQGEGADRALREIPTLDAENLTWGRYEGYVAEPGTDTLAQAQDAAYTEMSDKLASARLATNASDTVDQRYGVHYDVGDLVSVELDADEYVIAPIQTVNVQAWPTAGEVVGVTIGDQSARYDSDWIKRMLDLERRLGRQERR